MLYNFYKVCLISRVKWKDRGVQKVIYSEVEYTSIENLRENLVLDISEILSSCFYYGGSKFRGMQKISNNPYNITQPSKIMAFENAVVQSITLKSKRKN